MPNPETNTGGLYLGDLDAADDILLLKSLNITHVLTCTAETRTRSEYLSNSIKQQVLSLEDAEGQPLLGFFDSSNLFIDFGLKEGNVLVHCIAGLSRSASVVIAYLMDSRGIRRDKALQMVKNKRPEICPKEWFLEELLAYEKVLFK